jgi:hypothetical protein
MSEAQLSVAQRFRIAKARSQRLLAREWDESKHPRVPAGSPDGGQFGAGGGGAEGAPASKPKGKGKAKKEDFDKAKIKLDVSSGQQDAFIDRWNDKVGMEPAEFKSKFMGGLDGPMKLKGTSGKIEIDGEVHDSDGHALGTFQREINLDGKSAYSAYFKLNRSATKHDTGKKMLAGNIATYRDLGIETVGVSANIDVGGYAWAKYGYVPTPESWAVLRRDLEKKLTGSSSSSRPSSGNTMEAESWDMLSSDAQDDVRDRWMRDTRSEFIDSEVQNWRESGQALEDSKHRLVDLYNDSDMPEWATDALDAVREEREDNGDAPIPYTNLQLFKAISLDYNSKYGDGRDDPEVTFDDAKLQEPQGYDPAQGTLPGIDPLDPAGFLSQEMRDQIEKEMIDSFNKKAEAEADEMDPPDYVADSVEEYQDEYWQQKDDDEKLRLAIDYGMADIEIEPDEDEAAEPQAELELPPANDPLLDAVRSNDPKSIWKVADSPQGKALLLGTSWSGRLHLNDKEQMARFDKYVGKAA